MYGPVREEGSWRISNNNELHALMHGKKTVNSSNHRRLCSIDVNSELLLQDAITP